MTLAKNAAKSVSKNVAKSVPKTKKHLTLAHLDRITSTPSSLVRVVLEVVRLQHRQQVRFRRLLNLSMALIQTLGEEVVSMRGRSFSVKQVQPLWKAHHLFSRARSPRRRSLSHKWTTLALTSTTQTLRGL